MTITLGCAMTVSSTRSFSRIQPVGVGQFRVRTGSVGWPSGVDQRKLGIAPAALGMPAQRRYLGFELCRQPDIVGVQKGHVFASRLPKCHIADEGRPSGVRHQDHMDAPVDLQGLQVGACRLARAVVRDNELPVLESLLEDRRDCGLEEFEPVKGRHDDRHRRRHIGAHDPPIAGISCCGRYLRSVDIDIHCRELSSERRLRQLPIEMRTYRCARRHVESRRDQCPAQSLRVFAWPQRSHRAASDERTKGRNIGDDRRQSAGKRLYHRIAAAFVMTSEDEQVRRSHQLLDPFMGHPPQQMHSVAKAGILGDSPFDIGQQRCPAKAAP